VTAHQPSAAAADRRIDDIDDVVADPPQKRETIRQSKLPLLPVHEVDFAVMEVSLQALEPATAPRAVSTALMSP